MISELIYLEYLECLLEGDKAKCTAIIHHLLENNVEVKEIYINLFQKSLYQVGKMWERDNLCGAKEHMAATITECMMGVIYSKIASVKKNDKKVVVACVPKEFHSIGARMVSDMFELNGWCSYLLGANSQKSELCKLLDEKKPQVLALSLSTYFNVLRLIETIDEVKKKHPSVKIIVGGYAFKENGTEALEKYSDVEYIPDLNELDKYIRSFEFAVT